MIDLCSRLLIRWPLPHRSDSGFSYTRWFSCPLERSLFLIRHDLGTWGVASSL